MLGDAQVRRTDPFVTARIGRGDASRSSSTGVIPAAAFREAAAHDVARARGRMPAPWPRRCGASAPASCARSCSRARSRSAVDRRFDPRRLAHRLRAVDPARVHVHRAGRRRRSSSAPRRSCSSRGTAARCARTRSPVPRRDRATRSRIARTPIALARLGEGPRGARDRRRGGRRGARPLCATLDVGSPSRCCWRRPNVWHLSTRFRGRLAEPAPSALDLALALHPTPAVGRGARPTWRAPRSASSRGSTAGPTRGPSGGSTPTGTGSGRSRCGARCLRGDRATLYAGAGIVGGSDPDAEARRDRPEVPRVPRRAALGVMRCGSCTPATTRKGWLDGPWNSDLADRDRVRDDGPSTSPTARSDRPRSTSSRPARRSPSSTASSSSSRRATCSIVAAARGADVPRRRRPTTDASCWHVGGDGTSDKRRLDRGDGRRRRVHVGRRPGRPTGRRVDDVDRPHDTRRRAWPHRRWGRDGPGLRARDRAVRLVGPGERRGHGVAHLGAPSVLDVGLGRHLDHLDAAVAGGPLERRDEVAGAVDERARRRPRRTRGRSTPGAA